MPKQNTPSTPDEELPAAAIAFMKNGSVRVQAESTTPVATPDGGKRSDARTLKVASPRKKRRPKHGSESLYPDSSNPAMDPPRRPFSTRIRTDLYVRLKETSLTRELKRKPPFHMSEIVEQAIEAWLENGD